MPFRTNEFRVKMQFLTSSEMPHLVHKACKVTDTVSNTVYVQHAIAAALARDLNVPVESILANLPPPRAKNSTQTVEDVR